MKEKFKKFKIWLLLKNEIIQKLSLGFLFSLLIGLIFRSFSDIHDGLSLRAEKVGWWAWHVVNWFSRDVWQGLLSIFILIIAAMEAKLIGKPAVIYIGVSVVVLAVISFFWHNLLYEWTVNHQQYFTW